MYDVAQGHVAGLVAGAVVVPTAWLVLRELRLAARDHQGWAARFVERYEATSALTRTAAALILVSGAVHLALVPGHLGPKGVTAFLFLIDGLALTVISVAAFITTWWRRPAAWLLTANLFAYVVWTVAGWEASDQVGIATKLVELVALGLVMRLAIGKRRTLPRRVWRAASLPLITAVTSMGVWAGGLAHPDALHVHAGALLQAVPTTPTPAQRQAAMQLLAATRTDIGQYADPAAAARAGFELGPVSDADPLVHFTNKANAGAVLDPARPQALVYVRTKHGLLLAGAMFQMPRIGQWGPDPGGPLTQWHQHEGICFTPLGFEFSLESPFWTCPVGSISVTTPPMLHVWIIDNPKGPFSADLDQDLQRRLQAG